jgi:hypothetical protein
VLGGGEVVADVLPGSSWLSPLLLVQDDSVLGRRAVRTCGNRKDASVVLPNGLPLNTRLCVSVEDAVEVEYEVPAELGFGRLWDETDFVTM